MKRSTSSIPRGYKFSTYGHLVDRQAITRSIADQARTIRIPVHMIRRINKMTGSAGNAAGDRQEPDPHACPEDGNAGGQIRKIMRSPRSRSP